MLIAFLELFSDLYKFWNSKKISETPRAIQRTPFLHLEKRLYKILDDKPTGLQKIFLMKKKRTKVIQQ